MPASVTDHRTLNICRIIYKMYLQSHLQLSEHIRVNEYRRQQGKDVSARTFCET